MKWETTAGLPTRGLIFQQMIEKLNELSELAAMMAHLVKAEGTVADEALGNGWLIMSEAYRLNVKKITDMAIGRLN